jgi:hypothetical protein
MLMWRLFQQVGATQSISKPQLEKSVSEQVLSCLRMILLINSDNRHWKDKTPLQNFEETINHAGSLSEADQIDSPVVEQLTNNDLMTLITRVECFLYLDISEMLHSYRRWKHG